MNKSLSRQNPDAQNVLRFFGVSGPARIFAVRHQELPTGNPSNSIIKQSIAFTCSLAISPSLRMKWQSTIFRLPNDTTRMKYSSVACKCPWQLALARRD